jgi:hypothetical protein
MKKKWKYDGTIKLSLCFNAAPRHEGVLGSGGIVPNISYWSTLMMLIHWAKT